VAAPYSGAPSEPHTPSTELMLQITPERRASITFERLARAVEGPPAGDDGYPPLHPLHCSSPRDRLRSSRTVGGRLLPGPCLARGMLAERQHPAGHESRPANGFAGARDLEDLDDPPSGGDFDPPARARGDDLIRARAVVCRNHDLHTIALH